MSRFLRQLVVLVVVVAAAVWWAAAESSPRAREKRSSPPAPRMPLLSPEDTYHGMSWHIHHAHGCVDLGRRLLGEIADLGADTVLLGTAAFQEHAGSATFAIDPERTPSPEQWQEIFDIAHDNGLRVILMPIVLLSDARGTEWRGVISPPNWDDWWARYEKYILRYAELAEAGDVEVLMIGSELISTERFTDRWRGLIRKVRQVYDGKLSYSGNWDHYKVVEFWDDLDLVGMTSYYKLSSNENPSLESLIEAWRPIKRGLLRWQKQVGKPLLFTEVGWCSQEGASIEPWNYYYTSKATPEGLEVQRRCYRAFMETFKAEMTGDAPVVGGAIWWEWNDQPGGTRDINYTPRGKPAETELRNWFNWIRKQRRNATTSETGTGSGAEGAGACPHFAESKREGRSHT